MPGKTNAGLELKLKQSLASSHGEALGCDFRPGVESGLDELKLGRHVDCSLDRPIDGTARHVIVECPLNLGLVGVGIDLQCVCDVDPSDHKHIVIGFDLTCRLANESSLAGGYLTRFQRASERPR